ncbi:MAG: 2Fe-2S iron-sulfur cluster-binding protein, partial [Pseudomonadota bacterium]
MAEIRFLLNGAPVTLTDPDPMCTLLEWLRDTKQMTGTKEGCNEGDCGACTVVVQDQVHTAPLNACILMLPQLHGKAITTVEGLGGTHPVQEAMVAEHGSQCGFCTPGIVMSLVAGQTCQRTDHDDVLAGNLCRCTGYAPIARAAQAAPRAPLPDTAEDLATHLAQAAPDTSLVP